MAGREKVSTRTDGKGHELGWERDTGRDLGDIDLQVKRGRYPVNVRRLESGHNGCESKRKIEN